MSESNPVTEHVPQTGPISTLIAGKGTERLDRKALALVHMPESTATHRVVPHIEMVSALVETLGFRQLSVVKDEYAVSTDGAKMFGLLELSNTAEGIRFAIGIMNSHDKSMRLALTVGYRVMVCSNMAFHGDFTPVLAKHSKNFNLIDTLSIAVDRIQRSFEPMQRRVTAWRAQQLSDDRAKLVIYKAFVED